MPHPYYPGRRDLEQEAEDKRRTRTSEREALDAAAVRTRAALLKHIGKIMPGQIAPPAWETYRNSPGVSGNSEMTDYILRYNAKNPQRPFQPEVYTPQPRRAAPAVAPAAAPRRVMANAPAVGVQAGAPLAPQSETAAEMEKRTSGGMEDALNAQGAVQDIAKKNLTPDQMNERASAVQQSASGAQQPGPLDTLRSATPRPPGIRDDGEVAIQKFLRNEIANMNPDNRPGAKVGWAEDGRNGQKLVSAVDRNGIEYSDARREFYRKHAQDRADAYAGTMQLEQKPTTEGLRAWNKANPFNSDMYERDARAYADAATAPRAVTSRALNQAQGVAAGAPADAFNAMRMPDGSLGYARPGGSPTLTTGRSASATMPNGKVERTVFTRPSTPQGLGQNVNDDPNSPYRLLAAAGSNPAAPMPSTSPVKTEGTALYNRTEVSPMDALISPKVGYGANAPSAIASAQSYQAANPGIKFINKVDDETLSVKYPIVNSNKEDTGAWADFDAYRKLITTYPEGRSTSDGNQEAIIAHELLHGTQPRPMDTPSVIARAKEAIRTRNDTVAYSSTDAEAGARLPRLNRAWVNAGNSFPQNTDDAAKIYSAFGIHPPGKPSKASPPQGWDQDPANKDIKDMIKSYRLMPKRKQREFYDKWLQQQPGLASRDRSNGFESAA